MSCALSLVAGIDSRVSAPHHCPRTSDTTAPSFLNQNGLMYGVIRRQDYEKKRLTPSCKTALVRKGSLTCRSGAQDPAQ